MKRNKLSSKDMYNMLTQEQKNISKVLRVHYDQGYASIWEDCGLIRTKEIKKDKSVKNIFSIKYNRKELLKLAIK